MKNLRQKIIQNGVKNLREFGYPEADEKTILTDIVYKAFFVSMLEENLGFNPDADKEINKILKELGEK